MLFYQIRSQSAYGTNGNTIKLSYDEKCSTEAFGKDASSQIAPDLEKLLDSFNGIDFDGLIQFGCYFHSAKDSAGLHHRKKGVFMQPENPIEHT
ncbi:unnamed protein product [Anisakis simplex]|uniref:Peptidase n=1 Tax=Anisakis simplex TaxID=6269 RepID=A0A0M3K963_ANISI|nr:unnamed protein product [Anisakis simplex]